MHTLAVAMSGNSRESFQVVKKQPLIRNLHHVSKSVHLSWWVQDVLKEPRAYFENLFNLILDSSCAGLGEGGGALEGSEETNHWRGGGQGIVCEQWLAPPPPPPPPNDWSLRSLPTPSVFESLIPTTSFVKHNYWVAEGYNR